MKIIMSVNLHWILYVVAAVVLGHEISHTKAEELLVPYSLTDEESSGDGIDTLMPSDDEEFSADEVVLLSGVTFSSFLLILASIIILTVTIYIVVRRKRSESETNLIADSKDTTRQHRQRRRHRHRYHSHKHYDSDQESDDNSLHEQQNAATLLIEETTYYGNENINVSMPAIESNHQHEITVNQGFNLVKALPQDHVTVVEVEETKNEFTHLDIISNPVVGTKPTITRHEPVVHANEGEQVTLRIEYAGFPQPTVTWTFENVKIEGDYACEVNTSGSLVFFCVEPKHAGKYDVEINNIHGSAHASINLVVQEFAFGSETKTDASVLGAGVLRSNSISQDGFREYVNQLHSANDSGFEAQYKSLETGEDGKQINIGRSEENRGLNRFKNITAYDDALISLELIANASDCQHTYINASYINGYSQKNAYIASQGPLAHTIIDFWRLIWQEKVHVVAMVTNLREGPTVKCEQYWPDKGRDLQLGPFKILTKAEEVFPYYVIRRIIVKFTAGRVVQNVSREVVQYHFTSWPDHGTPESPGPTLNYLRRIKADLKSKLGPILVHCSAGVGRTGTLIAIDTALAQASKERQVDIPKIIVDMRKQRMKMVQTASQYVFLHDAILEMLTCGDTQIRSSDFQKVIESLKSNEKHKGRSCFDQQFQVLQQLTYGPENVVRSSALQFPEKNRSQSFLPPERWRVRLKGQTPDYVHASYADSYKYKKGFIVAQSPLKSTVNDFVKMLYERECGVVVMLCGCEEGGMEVCAQYWPTSVKRSLKFGGLMVSTVKINARKGLIKRMLTIKNPKTDSVHNVVQFHIERWSSVNIYGNPKVLIDSYNQIAEIQSNNKIDHIVVHGRDTVSRVGVFCSVVNAIEMCKTEGVVDVFQVVKALRIQKPGAVQTVNQYISIFDLVLKYMDRSV